MYFNGRRSTFYIIPTGGVRISGKQRRGYTKEFKSETIQLVRSQGKNVVTESFLATLKNELIYRNNYKTLQEPRQSIFRYIETFYNRIRKHSYQENKSPS